MIDFLVENWWLSLILVALLFLADHFLTVASAKLHELCGKEFYDYQHGTELNPFFEKEVKAKKWFTKKHLFSLLAIIFVFLGSHFLEPPSVFELFIGMFILTWFFIDMSHIINLLYFNDIRKFGGISGRVEISYRLSQKHLAYTLIAQASICCIPAIVTMRPFFWGGVSGFVLLSLRSFLLARRSFPEKKNKEKKMAQILWDELQLEEKIAEILRVESHEPGHHFGRPFFTPYQIAIEFKIRYPDDFEKIGKPVGGKGTGQQDSVAQYFALELSRHIKNGSINNIEGRFLHRGHLKTLQYYDDEHQEVESSLMQNFDLSLYRLLD